MVEASKSCGNLAIFLDEHACIGKHDYFIRTVWMDMLWLSRNRESDVKVGANITLGACPSSLARWDLPTDKLPFYPRIGGMFVSRSGVLYVTDSSNHLALIIQLRRGKTLWQRLGGFGSNLRSFSTPTGITATQNQLIFVADTDNNRVIKWKYPYSPAGDLAASNLNRPHAVAVEAHESLIVPYKRLFVADADSIYLFSYAGYKRPVTMRTLLSSPNARSASFAWGLHSHLIACLGVLTVFSEDGSVLNASMGETNIRPLNCSKVATRTAKDGLTQDVLVAYNRTAQFINGTDQWVHLGGPIVAPTTKSWLLQGIRSAIVEMEDVRDVREADDTQKQDAHSAEDERQKPRLEHTKVEVQRVKADTRERIDDVPRKSGKGQEARNDFPHRSGAEPEGLKDLPQSNGIKPEGVKDSPHGSSIRIEGLQDVAHGRVKRRETLNDLSDIRGMQRKELTDLPRRNDIQPEGLKEVPHRRGDGVDDLPRRNDIQPEGLQDVAHGRVKRRETRNDLSDIRGMQRKELTGLPQRNDIQPEGLKDVPHRRGDGVDDLPQRNGIQPEERGALPHRNGIKPEVLGKLSQKNGISPQGRGELPHKNGIQPEGSTDLPQRNGLKLEGLTGLPKSNDIKREELKDVPYRKGIKHEGLNDVPYRKGVQSKEQYDLKGVRSERPMGLPPRYDIPRYGIPFEGLTDLRQRSGVQPEEQTDFPSKTGQQNEEWSGLPRRKGSDGEVRAQPHRNDVVGESPGEVPHKRGVMDKNDGLSHQKGLHDQALRDMPFSRKGEASNLPPRTEAHTKDGSDASYSVKRQAPGRPPRTGVRAEEGSDALYRWNAIGDVYDVSRRKNADNRERDGLLYQNGVSQEVFDASPRKDAIRNAYHVPGEQDVRREYLSELPHRKGVSGSARDDALLWKGGEKEELHGRAHRKGVRREYLGELRYRKGIGEARVAPDLNRGKKDDASHIKPIAMQKRGDLPYRRGMKENLYDIPHRKGVRDENLNGLPYRKGTSSQVHGIPDLKGTEGVRNEKRFDLPHRQGINHGDLPHIMGIGTRVHDMQDLKGHRAEGQTHLTHQRGTQGDTYAVPYRKGVHNKHAGDVPHRTGISEEARYKGTRHQQGVRGETLEARHKGSPQDKKRARGPAVDDDGAKRRRGPQKPRREEKTQAKEEL